MDKKRILIIVAAIIISILAIIITNKDRIFQNKTPLEETEIEEEIGEINIAESPETLYEEGYDMETDGMIYAEDTDIKAVKQHTVVYQNIDLVYDLLTLQALSEINDKTYDYLNQHGYSETQILTIKDDSIIYERSYPYFEAEMEQIKDKLLAVRYDLEKQDFEFEIIDK